MAIFYEHIKGCGPNNNYISWIKWSNENSAPGNIDATYLPKILIGTDTTDGKKDFGTIITSDATGQTINQSFTFAKDIKVTQEISSLSIKATEKVSAPKLQCSDDTYILENIIHFRESSIESVDGEGFKFFSSGRFEFNKNVNITGDISSSGKCQASYFNATSDARAKINIIPAHFSALEVVNSIPTYTFNYINKPQERVLGLIAQEAAQHTLDGFNMVDNLTASGENGDYMQIKESKLVYVLWKAVQELTDEVESLKAQLNNLK